MCSNTSGACECLRFELRWSTRNVNALHQLCPQTILICKYIRLYNRRYICIHISIYVCICVNCARGAKRQRRQWEWPANAWMTLSRHSPSFAFLSPPPASVLSLSDKNCVGTIFRILPLTLANRDTIDRTIFSFLLPIFLFSESIYCVYRHEVLPTCELRMKRTIRARMRPCVYE